MKRQVALALLAGIVVFVLLFQWGGGVDADPPTCFWMFGWWTVPCGGWPAVAAGAVTAVVVWLALSWRGSPPVVSAETVRARSAHH